MPEIVEDASIYQGTFTHGQLSGYGDSTAKYKVYGDTPVSVDGFKKRVRIGGNYKETQLYENGHYARNSCTRVQFGSGNEYYSYQEYQTAGNPQRLWRLFQYKSSSTFQYHEQFYEDGEWNYVVRYNFNKESFTWTRV